jgi:hypothetical protein
MLSVDRRHFVVSAVTGARMRLFLGRGDVDRMAAEPSERREFLETASRLTRRSLLGARGILRAAPPCGCIEDAFRLRGTYRGSN